ncbi:steroid alpha reductase [Histoplasma capsulatum var. duboisii H88]|uniref:very-long-chain enoyl-CoA reductase n=2 Tax=Ajellomyces capsulatus TaxID=5037 RepID=F0UCG7_AJEC8|nr:steroid alpha reductase [Histoplasma capsulatum H143]EGC43243.1 steroid alpha reductase [Histoplasma capsulatum var. duboisii H88]QSS49428.1 steroid alpha reductase [Histoplasma capsulatum var. duboisii H88]
MASNNITLNVKSRGKRISKLPQELSINPNATGPELYNAIAVKCGLSIHRIRITKASDGTAIHNSNNATIHSTGLRNQSTIYVKDLGSQLSWRTVYLIEYFGPIFIHPMFLLPSMRARIYRIPNPPPVTDYQVLFCTLVVLHFVKRELESAFLHRFGRATMPALFVIRNSGYYWLLSGCNVAYWVYAPTSKAASTTIKSANPLLLYTGLALFIFGQLANLNSHVVLRNLRRPGTSERGIPSGFGFSLVTCPNYLFEVIAWIGVYLVSGLNWSMVLFIVVACTPMIIWGKQKERAYRTEFGDKYKKKRFVMLPGIV